MKEELLLRGWVDKGDVLVLFSHPRLGWKPDGTLIVGYHEWKEKITTIEKLEEILEWINQHPQTSW